MTPRRAGFISSVIPSFGSGKKNRARSFYISSRQNYRSAGALPGRIGYNIYEKKALASTLGIGAFGTQTVYRNAGR
jgi:hypothetical protein